MSLKNVVSVGKNFPNLSLIQSEPYSVSGLLGKGNLRVNCSVFQHSIAHDVPDETHLLFCLRADPANGKMDADPDSLRKRQLSVQGFRNQSGHLPSVKHPVTYFCLQTN